MADDFSKMLRKLFPGHADHFSAVNIGTLFLLFKKIKTATSPEEENKYSAIFNKEVENIKSTFGFDTNPEVFEADKIAQIRMDEEAKEKAKEKDKTKQFVA